jgi:type I restriction enzyme S subunit
LGDCVNFLSGGTPSKKNPEYWDGDIPWVSCKDMKTAYLSDSQDHITEAGAANGTRLVSPGTILIVVRGMILAQHFPVAIAKRKMAFNQDLKALQCTPNVDPKFLFHWLQGKSYEILGIADEAAHGTKRLQTDRLQNFPLHLPPLPLQRKIAAILSAYDDLIENNTRRIEILEEMARSLYHQWFVNFRFPGHEQVKMVDSELGLIPEGWEIKKVGDVAKVISGYAFKSNDFQEKGIPVIKIKNIRVGTVDLSDSQCVDPSFLSLDARYHVKGINLLISLTGSHLTQPNSVVGRVAIYSPHQGHCLLNQRAGKFLIKNPRYCDIPYLFYFLSSEEKRRDIALMASGAASQANISPTQVESLDLLIPSSNILDVFHRIAATSLEQINNLEAKNANLRRTRDLLLPKLISGEIHVENLNINTGEIAA